MDLTRVVEVWVPALRRVGSGYLLADRLVLTSYHVVQGNPLGAPVQVRALDDPQRVSWLSAVQCWPIGPVDISFAPEQDAALLVIDAAGWRADPLPGRVRFGQVNGQDRVACRGLGFPDAEARPRPDYRRDTMPVRGHADPLQARKSGLLTIHVDEGIVPRRRSGGSGWAGASGTALFSGPLLLGVLATDRAVADDASVLTAVPINTLIGLPGFGETLAAHGLQLRIEPAPVSAHEHLLRRYLHAASRADITHPYPGIRVKQKPLPLTAVYMQQQARRQPVDRHRDRGVAATPPDTTATRPADAVLAEGRTCVVIAGPGGGKSSLLRTCLARGAAAWQNGRGHSAIPVLVPAAALTSAPLADALAEAVSSELKSCGLASKLPAEFFDTSPQPAVPWLVLVDGLDEIIDTAARRKVLQTLASLADSEHADVYRFIVATRPIADDELNILGTQVPRFDLQPFSAADVQSVALGWFRALDLAEPDRVAKRFTRALARTQLNYLAGIPLMTSMLCQLHAAAPDQPLPTSRTHIYEEFIALLHKRQHAAGSTGMQQQTQATLQRYGDEALAQAQRTLDALPDLIAYLAAERHSGNTLPAVTLLESRTQALKPPRVLSDEWQIFLEECLRRSGVLTERAGQFVFLHQTFQDYFAVREAVRDPQTLHESLRRVFHRPATRGPVDSDSPSAGSWLPPHPSDTASYVGFLVDAAREHAPVAVAEYLSRLAIQGRLLGCEFIAELHQLATRLPEDVVPAAADFCVDLAAATGLDSVRLKAAKVLSELGDPRGAKLLRTFATTSSLDGGDRLEAAKALVGLGDPRAAELLHALATDTNLHDSQTYYRRESRTDELRESAAETLAMLGDPRGAKLLRTFATTSSLDGDVRLRAAKALVGLGDPRAAELLHALATDTNLHDHDRLQAAEALQLLGDPNGAELLHALATDTNLLDSCRLRAAEALQVLGDPRTAGLLHALATDTNLYDSPTGNLRVSAARALALLGDPRGAKLLHTLATDTTLATDVFHVVSSRVSAAEELAGLGDSRAADLLHTLATDTNLYGHDRLQAAEALQLLGDPDAAGLLHALATDTALRDWVRVKAAVSLAGLGGPRILGIGRTLYVDIFHFVNSALDRGETHTVVSDLRGSELLHVLATDTALDADARLPAAKALALVGDPRGAELIHDLATDIALDSVRLEAAEALKALGDSRAAEVLLSLVADATLSGPTRLQAVEALRELGHPRGAELLRAYCANATRCDYIRKAAAEALARLDDPPDADSSATNDR
ncbi:HEAT repeat domain-containing protein [Streptomyces hyaluromycini]|uniref:HEAT repeat domain-containing protein n=1 Tax=Streptomyces hyaluromycini TaxID=1377993 RepID=UPI000B5CF49E|nr:HEAT repeat domain-containing protein [Streptomyces hyaluromycini]